MPKFVLNRTSSVRLTLMESFSNADRTMAMPPTRKPTLAQTVPITFLRPSILKAIAPLTDIFTNLLVSF